MSLCTRAFLLEKTGGAGWQTGALQQTKTIAPTVAEVALWLSAGSSQKFCPSFLGLKLEAFVAGEAKPVDGQFSPVEITMKGLAAKRVDLVQTAGVDDDTALSAVLIVEQVEHFPCRGAVEIALGLNMQVAIACIERDGKTGAHGFFLSLIELGRRARQLAKL
jgi:hypothetical protein